MKIISKKTKDFKDSRTLYLDYLRIIAIVAVVILHAAGQKWYSVDFKGHQWQVFNIIDSAVRWAVPIFVMISGALFLDNNKKIEIKTLYSKYILRIFVATFTWSYIYMNYKKTPQITTQQTISKVIEGNYHMWYLFMIMGLYMVTPLLRKITESKKITEYFLILGTVMTFIVPRVTALIKMSEDPEVVAIINSINAAVKDMHFNLTLGYTFYFVLGYYLTTYDISKVVRILVYISGPIAYVTTFVLSDWHSNQIGKASSYFYQELSINVLLMAICVFVFTKYELSRIKIGKITTKLVLHLSKCSFGIYLVHILIMDELNSKYNFNTLSYKPEISVLMVTVVVFILAYITSTILNMIPVVKKYLV